MSRKILSLAVLAAAFTLVLGTTDAQARHCRSHHSHRGCCQNNNYGCGNQQTANCGIQQQTNCGVQQTSYATASTCCQPRATCCAAQTACATHVITASFSAPQPPVEQAAPAPAPGN